MVVTLGRASQSGRKSTPVQLGGSKYSQPVQLSKTTVPTKSINRSTASKIGYTPPAGSKPVLTGRGGSKYSQPVQLSRTTVPTTAVNLSTASKSPKTSTPVSTVNVLSSKAAASAVKDAVSAAPAPPTAQSVPSPSAVQAISSAAQSAISKLLSSPTASPEQKAQPVSVKDIAATVSTTTAKIIDDLAARVVTPETYYPIVKTVEPNLAPVTTTLLQSAIKRVQSVVAAPSVTSVELTPRATVLTLPDVAHDIKSLINQIPVAVKKEAASNYAPLTLPSVTPGPESTKALSDALSKPVEDKDFYFFALPGETPEEYEKTKQATKEYLAQQKFDPFKTPLTEQLKQTGTVVISPEQAKAIKAIDDTYKYAAGKPAEIQDLIAKTAIQTGLSVKHVAAAASPLVGGPGLDDVAKFKSALPNIINTAKEIASSEAKITYRIAAANEHDMDSFLNSYDPEKRIVDLAISRLHKEAENYEPMCDLFREHPGVALKFVTGEIGIWDIQSYFTAYYNYKASFSLNPLAWGNIDYNNLVYLTALAIKLGFTKEEVDRIASDPEGKLKPEDKERWRREYENGTFLERFGIPKAGGFGREEFIQWAKDPKNVVLETAAGVLIGSLGGFLMAGPAGAIAGAGMGVFMGTELPNYFQSNVFARAKEAAQSGLLGTEHYSNIQMFQNEYDRLSKRYNEAIKSGDFVTANETAKEMLRLNDQYANWAIDNTPALVKAGIWGEVVSFAQKVDQDAKGRVINEDATPRESARVDITGAFADVSKIAVNGQVVSGLTQTSLELPPGDYTVDIWDKRGTQYQYKVHVSDGKATVNQITGAPQQELIDQYIQKAEDISKNPSLSILPPGKEDTSSFPYTLAPNDKGFDGTDKKKVYIQFSDAKPDIAIVYDWETGKRLGVTDTMYLGDLISKHGWNVQKNPREGSTLEIPSQLTVEETQVRATQGIPVSIYNKDNRFKIWDLEGNKWVQPDFIYAHTTQPQYLTVLDTKTGKTYTARLEIDPRLDVNYLKLDEAILAYPVERETYVREEKPTLYVSGSQSCPGCKIKAGGVTIDITGDKEYTLPAAATEVRVVAPGYGEYIVSGSLPVKQIDLSRITLPAGTGSVKYDQIVPTSQPPSTQLAADGRLLENSTIQFTGAPFAGAKYYLDGVLIDPTKLNAITNVPPGTHILTIDLPGYKLRDVPFDVRSGEVASIPLYQHLVELPAERTYSYGYGGGGGGGGYTPTPKPVPETMIVFGESCRDARIWLDDTEIAPEIGKEYSITPGYHAIVVLKPGYKEWRKTVYFKEGDALTISPALEPDTTGAGGGSGYTPTPRPSIETLVIFGESCKDARIWLDDVEIAPEIGKEYSITPGYHAIIVRKDGYKEWRKTVYFKEGDTLTISPALEPDTTGAGGGAGYTPTPRPSIETLVIFGDSCRGARIWFDGSEIFPEIGTKYSVTPGYHAVVIRKDGYKEWTKTVYIGEGDTLTISPALEPEPVKPIEEELKRVDINTEPSGAKILIDDKWTGEFTPSFVMLAPGLYKLSIVKSGYLTIETPLYVGSVNAIDCDALRLAKEAGYPLDRFLTKAVSCGVV